MLHARRILIVTRRCAGKRVELESGMRPTDEGKRVTCESGLNIDKAKRVAR